MEARPFYSTFQKLSTLQPETSRSLQRSPSILVTFAPACRRNGFRPLHHRVSEFPFWLEGFKSLQEVRVAIPCVSDLIDPERRSELLEALMSLIENKVKAKGTSSKTENFFYRAGRWKRHDELDNDVYVYTWKAENASACARSSPQKDNVEIYEEASDHYAAQSPQVPTTSATTHSTMAAVSTKSVFPWEKLPFEIREKIFEDVKKSLDRSRRYMGGYFSWDGTMPPLVVALRPLPVSYEHVLKWFRKHNRYLKLDGYTGYVLAEMNAKEVQMVQSLSIVLEESREKKFPLRRTKTSKSMTRPFGTFEQYTKCFPNLPNLRDVRLSIATDFIPPLDVVDFITEFPFWLQGFKSLASVSVEIPSLRNVLDGDLQHQLLSALISRIHQKIGVKCKLLRMEDTFILEDSKEHSVEEDGVDFYEAVGVMDVWYWKAAKGKTMDWSQNLGWEWTFSNLMAAGSEQIDDPRGWYNQTQWDP
ncbi:uncharacterized protein PAC_12863 [Phialocephala subalpina]|uniref:Uncharacterized protein n=1 Tax=Phialocephala subalpina TaxID=576137 RepID=A0A1L7XD96_9HELO|nr:uncharacterized protein PAC_12863 [Phialocephala subalpina]